eukprot:Gb_24425 [translate_table: standard]
MRPKLGRGKAFAVEYEKRLNEIKESLRNIKDSHVWPFQFWFETDKAAYLLRQYFFSNLHDRISTRPFLSMIEKKWLAFQVEVALGSLVRFIFRPELCDCAAAVCIEAEPRAWCDIKCENVLVTSWNWVFLADYASFKPTYIPDDDPSDFSFFFDTGGRRRCYLAPECRVLNFYIRFWERSTQDVD